MSRHGQNEKLTFNNMFYYYGEMSEHDGYGGFDYLDDVLFMSRSTWTKPDAPGYLNHWCDTGYQNVCHGNGIAWIYEYGVLESVNLKETFSLQSVLAAASWSSDAV